MFGNIPVELLIDIVGYIHQPSHLYALCLVSKNLSSVATQFLYRDLVLDIPCDESARDAKLDLVQAVSMCDGLRYVRSLKVGPLEGRMVAIFDHLISRLQDHSLVYFGWDCDNPPLDSQLSYIWEHQRNIQSIDFMDMTNVVSAARAWKDDKLPQKYVHLSMDWPLPIPRDSEDFLEKLDLSCISSLAVGWYFWTKLPPSLSANSNQITNLKLYDLCLDGLVLDQFASLLRLELYRCSGLAFAFSTFEYPKLKDFRVETRWKHPPEEDECVEDEDFKDQYLFIRKFQGLETLAIEIPDERHDGSCLKNLTDSISLEHNSTLRCLALLDACNPVYGDLYVCNRKKSRNSLLDAVSTCTHLIQLELPTEWDTKKLDFKRMIDELPLLRILCFRLHIPWERFPGVRYEEELPSGLTGWRRIVSSSAQRLLKCTRAKPSNLRLLTIAVRGRYTPRQCFIWRWPLSLNMSAGIERISERRVKYHVPEYELISFHSAVKTWRDYCADKRFLYKKTIEEKNRIQGHE
ncbi:hypothetical protein MMC31_002476 [Peltigera leucophlebia]|nr:hypothetical protein [Peltigera leucophlebia]